MRLALSFIRFLGNRLSMLLTTTLILASIPAQAGWSKAVCQKYFPLPPPPPYQKQSTELQVRIRYNFRILANRDLGENATERLMKAVESSKDPMVKGLAEMLMKEDFEVAMNGKEDWREDLADNGLIKNFHQTGKQNIFSTSLIQRNIIEAALLNMPEESFLRLPDELKPKYAYLRPKRGSRIGQVELQARPEAERGYGPDKLIYSPQRIGAKYLSLSIGDSLNNNNSHLDHLGFIGPRVDLSPKIWTKALIPWSDRLLALLAMNKTVIAELRKKDRVQQVLFIYPHNVEKDAHGYPNSRIASVIGEGPLAFQYWLYSYLQNYFEIQIWHSGLSLDHAVAFEFRVNPPQGKFLEALLRRRIEIRDARVSPVKIWTP